MRRRALLSLIAVASAGCASTDPSTSSPTDSPGSGKLSPATASPTPEALPEVEKPEDKCEVFDLSPSDYPEIPGKLNGSSAEEFALTFEKEYTAARIDSEEGRSFSGYDGFEAHLREQTGERYLLKVEVNFDYQEGGEQSTIYGSDSSAGWYYVTSEYAVRARANGTDEIPSRGWITVSCKESAE